MHKIAFYNQILFKINLNEVAILMRLQEILENL